MGKPTSDEAKKLEALEKVPRRTRCKADSTVQVGTPRDGLQRRQDVVMRSLVLYIYRLRVYSDPIANASRDPRRRPPAPSPAARRTRVAAARDRPPRCPDRRHPERERPGRSEPGPGGSAPTCSARRRWPCAGHPISSRSGHWVRRRQRVLLGQRARPLHQRTRLLLRSSQLIPRRRVAVVDSVRNERVQLSRLGRRSRPSRQIDPRVGRRSALPRLPLVVFDRLPRCPRDRRDIPLALDDRMALVQPERRADAASEERHAEREPARSSGLFQSNETIEDGRTKRKRALRSEVGVCLAEPGA